MIRAVPLFLLIAPLVLAACTGDPPAHDEVWKKTTSRVTVDKTLSFSPSGYAEKHVRPQFRDAFGRYVYFHGVNLSGSTKFPATEQFDPEKGVLELGDDVSYVGKPFPLEDANLHFSKLRDLGFNSVRLLINWEGIQHAGPWTYDEEYLDYLEAVVDRARVYGIYVLLDMHQDLFSRHLVVKYNKHPVDENGKPYERGSLEANLMGLSPPYDNWVRGDGAPKWVVQEILKEKDLDSEFWGTPNLFGGIGLEQIGAFYSLFSELLGGEGGGELPGWVTALLENLPGQFDITESSDMLPWTMWGVNGATSLDVQRCFAAFFAGDTIYPDREIEGKNLKDYLQENYANSFVELAKRMKDKPNVIGYDIMNEPITFFITMTAVAAFFQSGTPDSMLEYLTGILGDEMGEWVHTILIGLYKLPPDASPETIKKWGFEGADLMAMLNLSYGFDANYLQPFYERVGQAIQEVDENAIIWFEMGHGANLLFGDGLPQWQINMTKLKGVKQAVFAPHWYPDIYPFIGINQPPREFSTTEWKYRDFTEDLTHFLEKGTFSLGNVPVVMGEFGTYYNFNGIENSVESDYEISAQVLDAYYRAFEELGLSHIQWCYSPENTFENGDGWNLEDFSIVGPDLKPRGHLAFARPYARATSGRKIAARFHSPYEYLEPEKGKPSPVGEFVLEMEGKETDAPTEIFVPRVQYPRGFYVTVSDGHCYYDDKRQLLTWYPANDEPGAVHALKLQAPRPGVEIPHWDYFFEADTVFDLSGGAS